MKKKYHHTKKNSPFFNLVKEDLLWEPGLIKLKITLWNSSKLSCFVWNAIETDFLLKEISTE